jgi:hypothetical protein
VEEHVAGEVRDNVLPYGARASMRNVVRASFICYKQAKHCMLEHRIVPINLLCSSEVPQALARIYVTFKRCGRDP